MAASQATAMSHQVASRRIRISETSALRVGRDGESNSEPARGRSAIQAGSQGASRRSRIGRVWDRVNSQTWHRTADGRPGNASRDKNSGVLSTSGPAGADGCRQVIE